MRGLFFGIGTRRRNVPVRIPTVNPVPNYGDRDVYHGGDAGLSGFSVLSQAIPERQGTPPFVPGVAGPEPIGPDDTFEQ